MHSRAVRVLTALAVMVLCGLVVSEGWSIARFVSARTGASNEEQALAARSWIGVPGLAGAALEASLTNVADASDTGAARKRADELETMLGMRPLSSTNWLSLAGMRLITGQPFDKVVGALALSSLTGANEGAVMLQRGTFGLLQWEFLPAETRKRTIADLAGALLGTTVRDGEIAPAKGVLSGKAADTRREIADLLRAEGVSPGELARMGL